MASRAIVSMNAQGRLTIPAAARLALRVHDDAQFEWEVRNDELVLRPVVVVPRDDAWVYTPEHVALVERARRDVREGRLRSATDADLDLADAAGPADPVSQNE